MYDCVHSYFGQFLPLLTDHKEVKLMNWLECVHLFIEDNLLMPVIIKYQGSMQRLCTSCV